MVARDVALSERWVDGSGEVREVEFALGRDPERRLSMEGTRALGEALAGRPVDALRVAAGVRRAAVVANMTIMRVEVEVAEALAHREMGDRARALDDLEALAAGPASTMLFCQVLAMCELVHAYLDGGDVARAHRRARPGGGRRGPRGLRRRRPRLGRPCGHRSWPSPRATRSVPAGGRRTSTTRSGDR